MQTQTHKMNFNQLCYLDHSKDSIPSQLNSKRKLFSVSLENEAAAHLRKEHGEETAQVISFLGDTHSGKTTLISDSIKKPLSVASHGDFAPTSADVSYYLGQDSDESNAMLYLDFEGSGGGKKLPNDLNGNPRVEVDKAPKKYMKRRLNSVEENFPRLAYLSSDIIVYVSLNTFANSDYLESAIKMGKSAVAGVKEAYKPSLILVSNVCSNSAFVGSIDQATKKFLEAHTNDYADENESDEEDDDDDEEDEQFDAGMLKDWFSSVHCVCIPDKERESDLFQQQTTKLDDLINNLMRTRNQDKKQKGMLYSVEVWTYLLRNIINDFSSPRITFSLKLLEAMAQFQGTEMLKILKVWDLCKDLEITFEDQREIFAKMLATFIAERYMAERITLGDNVYFNENHKQRRATEARKTADMFASQMVELTPCSSVIYPKKFPNGVPCVYTKFSHDKEKHYNPDFTRYNKLIRSFRAKFIKTDKQVHSWKGKFQTHVKRFDPTQIIEWVNKLLDHHGSYQSDMIKYRVHCIRELATNGDRENMEKGGDNFCWLCCTNSSQLSQYICGHEVCSECKSLVSDDVEFNIIDDFVEDEVFDHTKCPFCMNLDISFSRAYVK
eukprot:gb/GECH01012524.1/.p1 GENE.gb/GECH01012524.1/~~gb/GECH01012524.1/.p1  ORF type:complete len:610 (+),score=129.95 gb/GECH01012524.1/:1-1830(+)